MKINKNTQLEYKNYPHKSYCKYLKILEIDNKNKKALLFIGWCGLPNTYTKKWYKFDYINKIFTKENKK